MSSSFFFLQAEKSERNSAFIDSLENYAEQKKEQIYIIDKPLGDNKYIYEYTEKLIILVPNHKIILINTGDKEAEFEDFTEDFIEDLGSISDKYRYKDVIGRPRYWRESLIVKTDKSKIELDIETFLRSFQLDNSEDKKKCELLISLLTGSINDIEKVKGNVPDNILDKIKQKIILFDGDQTRFIYQKPDKKRITIQGLSGTGKTELLLHKLKDIYVDCKGSKIFFTCHNKILADSLRNRIPDFFNFMKVEEQILWNKRLWCVHSWGSQRSKDSGAYSYICNFYNLSFLRYNKRQNFDTACQIALKNLTESYIKKHGYAFDYMLVDESQDFPKSFFELCEKVTKETVYIAGDIFQSIFDDSIISEIKPDYLLSKCYRTDPKTLMFAHALGMGLFESPKLRWLEDKEWEACGYLVNKENGEQKYELRREPLRRFEDLEYEGVNSVSIVKTSSDNQYDAEDKILEIIKQISKENPTVLPDDIGIIYIDSSRRTYSAADKLEQSIPREFGWKVNKAYESKESTNGEIFVSNKNNVKGLEFPFVICVTRDISSSRNYRNSLYMMLTRSFIKSYLLTSQDNDSSLIEKLSNGLKTINSQGCLRVTVPSEEEKIKIRTTITYNDESISYFDFIYGIFDEMDIPNEVRNKLFNVVKNVLGDDFDDDKVRELIEFNYNKMNA